MGNQRPPDTDTLSVIKASIAWDIVVMTTAQKSWTIDDVDKRRIALTNDFIEVYRAISKYEPIELDK